MYLLVFCGFGLVQLLLIYWLVCLFDICRTLLACSCLVDVVYLCAGLILFVMFVWDLIVVFF